MHCRKKLTLLSITIFDNFLYNLKNVFRYAFLLTHVKYVQKESTSVAFALLEREKEEKVSPIVIALFIIAVFALILTKNTKISITLLIVRFKLSCNPAISLQRSETPAASEDATFVYSDTIDYAITAATKFNFA